MHTIGYLIRTSANLGSVYLEQYTHIMSMQRGQKLNLLQRLLPEGMVASSSWLEDKGYSRGLRSKYVANGWLTQPARGIYARPGGDTKWQNLVISMQSLMRLPLAVGGLTALELQGYGHYVRIGTGSSIYLYTERRLAKWLSQIDLPVKFEQRNANRLFKEPSIEHAVKTLPDLRKVDPSLAEAKLCGGLKLYSWGDRPWPMIVSSPERAILEFLNELPDKQSFEHAGDLFNGLVNLSPRRLQGLLETCDSVKVTRLFLWFAERYDHPWMKHLDVSAIDTGSGKRVIAKAGRLNPKYQITVPEGLNGH